MKKNFIFSNKYYLLTLILIIIIFFIFIFFSYYEKLEEERFFKNQSLKRSEAELNLVLDAYKITADSLFENILDTPAIKSIIYQALNNEEQRDYYRQKLKSKLNSFHQNLERYNLKEIHFHFKDGISFLRMHQPEKFGDQLFAKRKSIKYVNTEAKRFLGFEEGCACNGYRYIYPLNYQGQHIGSIGLGLSFTKITDLLGKNFKGLKLFIIKTDLLEKIAFADQKAKYKNFSFLKNYSYNYNNYNQIFEQKNKFNLAVIEEINLKNKAKLESQLKSGNSFTISQRISGSYYTGTFIRITGVDGLTKGYLISYQADQALNFISQKFLNILIIAIAFLILSLILLRIIFLNNHKLRLLAHNDELTEINNRRHLTNILTKEFNRHQRYNSSFAFIIFDIDYFKNVNDNYGHDEGDRILKELSELIKNNIRQSDHFGRWGGEEFVLLAPETELKAAYKLAEKLRKAIAAYNFIQAENVTASFGIAVIENEENIEELIKRADNALYRAKAKGRNRVEID